MRLINFCANIVSLDAGKLLVGGQADRLTATVRRELDAEGVEWQVSPQPVESAVNVYLTHRSAFRPVKREVGVFMSHGIADKGWRSNTTSMYRASFVSGPAWSLKLLDNGAKLHEIFEAGYPKLDPLFKLRAEFQEERTLLGPHRPVPTVLWAPTHGGGGLKYAFSDTPPSSDNAHRSSWWHRVEMREALASFDMIESAHPRHRTDGQATFDEFIAADVVVADGGSTIYEAWALGLPVVFPSWITRLGNSVIPGSRNTLESDIYKQGIGRHAESAAHLTELVAVAATEGITEEERRFIDPILPPLYRGMSGRLHADVLTDLAKGLAAPRHGPSLTFESFRLAGRVERVAVGSQRHKRYSEHPKWIKVDR